MTDVDMAYDTIIVGGGLCGLYIASMLEQNQSKPYLLLEANNYYGGRLKNNDNKIDVGGTWLFSGSNPLFTHWTSFFGLTLMQQLEIDDSWSDSIFSNGSGHTCRVQGGAHALCRAFLQYIPKANRHLDSPVNKVEKMDNNMISISILNKDRVYLAERVIMCAPPAVMSRNIEFSPRLSPSKELAMKNSDTWMSYVTKVVFEFKSRFWLKYKHGNKDGQLMNTGLSRENPGMFYYDSSTSNAYIDALGVKTDHKPDIHEPRDKGTISVTLFTISHPQDSDSEFLDICINDFVENHGNTFDSKELTKHLKDTHIYRWSSNPYISTQLHPNYKMNEHPRPSYNLRVSSWNGALLFAGSETDTHHPGFIEGALSSALRVCKELELDIPLTMKRKGY